MLRQITVACYVKCCMYLLPAIHKLFKLLIGLNDIVWHDVTKLPAFCLAKTSFYRQVVDTSINQLGYLYVSMMP